MAVITALMLPAVVYLRAHYLLDVPAGLLAGWAAYLASRPVPARKPDRGGMIAQDRNHAGCHPHPHPCEASCPPALPTP